MRKTPKIAIKLCPLPVREFGINSLYQEEGPVLWRSSYVMAYGKKHPKNAWLDENVKWNTLKLKNCPVCGRRLLHTKKQVYELKKK